MTLRLAVDTATDLASIALGDADGVRAEITVAHRRHAAALTPAVEAMLAVAGARFSDLAAIVVADGPGSFTGLRIGWATVQGIVRAEPRIAVQAAPSLMATAWKAAPFIDGPVAALYDALRGDVFGAVYRFAPARIETRLAPRRGSVAELAEAAGPATVAIGDGAIAYGEAVRRWTGRAPVPPSAGASQAAALLELADVAGACVPVPDVTQYEPDYGRPAEAQSRWERQHGRPLPPAPGHLR